MADTSLKVQVEPDSRVPDEGRGSPEEIDRSTSPIAGVATPVKVLMVGHCSSVFICPLAANLKRRAHFGISVVDLVRVGNSTPAEERALFDHLHEFPEPVTRTFRSRVRTLMDAFLLERPRSRRATPAGALRVLRSGRGLSAVKTYLGDESVYRNRGLMLRRWAQDVDVVHEHFIEPYTLGLLEYLPPSVKLMITVWGSDLFRLAGPDVYRRQYVALERADLITMPTLEMKEIFLAKFGRHLGSKVRLIRWGINLEAVDNCRVERRTFLEKYRIGPDKLIVSIGYGGRSLHQHVAALRALARLPEPFRDRIVVILHMSYGAEPQYVAEVDAAARESGLDVRIIREFLNDDDVGLLRLCSDIMINVQEVDAFSGSMCETLYAGNVMITGAWLPYGLLRRSGVHYHEIESIADLPGKLIDVIDNFATEKLRAKGNPEKIRKLVSWEYNADHWLRAYHDLMRR